MLYQYAEADNDEDDAADDLQAALEEMADVTVHRRV